MEWEFQLARSMISSAKIRTTSEHDKQAVGTFNSSIRGGISKEEETCSLHFLGIP
jgi:hypothetical protein